MRYRLDMTLRQAEGSLLRVLGTTQRRGYQTIGVNGETSSDGDRWHVSLIVESDRPGEVLKSQLDKLYDCLAVEVAPC
ncbi:MAG: acetolactate synthase [Gammaproteobacteria bacterium HGW-Gammaproteobacteria-4]|jgi:acetolactate synthase II small subunit|nr:MAG: acetolactate synthase [Gammaproteobacteria bacterium HGW-Gammaproteobacteria-4]